MSSWEGIVSTKKDAAKRQNTEKRTKGTKFGPHAEISSIDEIDRGIIRLLDLTFIAKDEDGNVAGVELADLGAQVEEFQVFEGASSGVLSNEDIEEAGAALDPGTSAALLVFENAWAGPFAAAVRRSGGQLVATGRIPVQAMLAALDAVEAA